MFALELSYIEPSEIVPQVFAHDLVIEWDGMQGGFGWHI
jgi:hypothetical protein